MDPEPGPDSWFADNGNPSALQIYVKTYNTQVLDDMKSRTPANLCSIGNEINAGFVWTAAQTLNFYQLVYAGCQAVRDWDSANGVSTATGVLLHLAGISVNGGVVCNNCADLAYAETRWLVVDSHGNPAHIPFDAFRLSYHAWDATLATLQSDFYASNLGQFGKYLVVQETEWWWASTSVTVNGTTTYATHAGRTEGTIRPTGSTLKGTTITWCRRSSM